MGCDIHAHCEVKMEGEWRHYAALEIDRNYKLFALMANVRNYEDIDPISKPKGLPKDITYLTKVDYRNWGVDAHDESYLKVNELIELRDRYQSIIMKNIPFFYYEIFGVFLFRDSLIGWYKYPNDNRMDIEDLRVVFWFDN